MCNQCKSDGAEQADVDPRYYEEKARSIKSLEHESPLLTELDRVDQLLAILENTFEVHQIKLQPILSDVPTAESGQVSDQYNPIWGTEAGQRIRQLANRIENLTDRVSYTSRATQV